MPGRFVSQSRWAALGLAVGLLMSLVGCGDKGRAMTQVSGTVTLDGAPLDDAQILFRRTLGEQRGYGGVIKEGAYKLECEQGEVKVEVTAYRIVPGKFTTVNGPKEPVKEMYIPKKYNEKTTLITTLSGSRTSYPIELTTK
jgi:hypothetical protein